LDGVPNKSLTAIKVHLQYAKAILLLHSLQLAISRPNEYMALEALYYNKITETNDNGDPFSRKPSLKSYKALQQLNHERTGKIKLKIVGQLLTQ